MNPLLTPIPYAKPLDDLKELGRLSLSDQVTRQIIVPIGNSNPDSGESAAISRVIKSDSSGDLLTSRRSIGYSDMTEVVFDYTSDDVLTSITWPAGYKELWLEWSYRYLTTFVKLVNADWSWTRSLVYRQHIKWPGINSDFILLIDGNAGRHGTIDFWFLK